MKIKKRVLVLGILLLFLIIISVVVILNSDSNSEKKKEPVVMELDFESRITQLKEFNSGEYYKIGWLQVQGTNIDLPIIDFTSNSNDLDYSFAWRSPFYETGQNREVLIGHNILNVSSTPMLSNENLQDFESLMSFSYAEFAENNLYIQYTKDGKEELYLIYAIGFYDYDYDRAEGMTDLEEIAAYIKTVKKNSIYDYDIDVNENDQLLTVKTCTRYFGANEKQQFIVDARKVREDEKTIKYEVSTNKNFEDLILNEKVN